MTDRSLDRITHRKKAAFAELDDLIDEIVITAPSFVHVEMMSKSGAWMQLGEHVFWVWAKKGKLSIRYSERRPETAPAVAASTPGGQG